MTMYNAVRIILVSNCTIQIKFIIFCGVVVWRPEMVSGEVCCQKQNEWSRKSAESKNSICNCNISDSRLSST